MMKKNKTMIVAVLAIMLTISIGYALFSQTINVTGSATAQGSFQITSECSFGIDDDISTIFPTMYTTTTDVQLPTEGGYSNDTCSVTNNNVTFNATLAYPGATRYFTVKMTNTGSVAAELPFEITDPLDYYVEDLVCADADSNGTIDNSTECFDVVELLNSGDSGDAILGGLIDEINAIKVFDMYQQIYMFQQDDGSFLDLESDEEEEALKWIDFDEDNNPSKPSVKLVPLTVPITTKNKNG